MRRTALLPAVVLTAALVAGCGGGGGSHTNAGSAGSNNTSNSSSSNTSGSYCSDLKAAKTDFASSQSGSPDFSNLDHVVSTFHKLAASAPPEVSADWKTLDDAFGMLQKTLADAGLKFSDLGTVMQGKMPPGFTAADMASLAPKLQTTFASLQDPKFQAAADRIEKHAKSTCHVTLNAP